mgnify:FL=1|jgi:hypothetical protein
MHTNTYTFIERSSESVDHKYAIGESTMPASRGWAEASGVTVSSLRMCARDKLPSRPSAFTLVNKTNFDKSTLGYLRKPQMNSKKPNASYK